MRFEQWLERQINRDDVVGDLAKDVKDDSRPKPSNNTLDAWQTFLFTAGASREDWPADVGALALLRGSEQEHGVRGDLRGAGGGG